MKPIAKPRSFVLAAVSLLLSGCGAGDRLDRGRIFPLERRPAVASVTPRTESGIGLTGVADWSTQYPFLDLMKQARPWRDWGSQGTDFALDDRGWVTSLANGQTAGTVFLTVPSGVPKIYDRVVVLYEGDGEIEYGWKAKKIESLSRPGRDVVALGQGNHLLNIVRTNPKNYIRNIRIVPEQHLKTYQRGEIFNPDWLARLEGFQALRFMDWMATNDSEVESWQQRPRIEDRTWAEKRGVPLEVMLELANRLEVDPWFNIPHRADSEYIRKFATLVRSRLDSDLNVYVEHSNEVWNWQFAQAHDARDMGEKRWGDEGNAYLQWHGMRTAQICDTFKQQVFTRNPRRVKCVLGVQTAWRGAQTAMLECPLWVAEGNKPCHQSGLDYLAITTYFEGGLNGPRRSDANPAAHTNLLRSWLREPDGGMAKAFEQLTDGRHLRSIEPLADYRGLEAELRDRFAYWNTSAEQYGLGLVAYEGGQHITANGHALEGDRAIQDFHIALNRHPRMKEIYASMLNLWQESGGELHVHFVDIAAPSKWGSWGALEHLNQPTSPKWEALNEFNRKLAREQSR